VGTLALTAFLYIEIPKGFFPVQDTGLIQGISEAPQSVSFDAMAERQQALAAAVLKDPDVESLSSFIGVDGTNMTLNAGRLLINLKAHDSRSVDVSEVIRRLERETAGVEGISLYMQPVQDLTIDATISRAQYRFILEDANPNELASWAQKLVDKIAQLPQLEDVTSDMQNQGLAAYIAIDRDSAARFGITPATIDNALYDAFGQRIISTIFTESSQYRVILEANPSFQSSLKNLDAIYLPSSTSSSGQVPLSSIAQVS
jgi:multidrug efflux pump